MAESFLKKLKPKPDTTAKPTNAVPLEEHEATRRQLAEAQYAVQAAKAEAARLADQARAAKAAADKQAFDSWLRTQTTKHNAIKHEHVAKLLSDELVWRDGKVVVNGKPDVDPEKHVAEWFAGDGQHYAKPVVQPGAGAPSQAGVVPQSSAPDLSRHGQGLNQDRTNFVRLLSPVTKPTAPTGPVAVPSAASKP